MWMIIWSDNNVLIGIMSKKGSFSLANTELCCTIMLECVREKFYVRSIKQKKRWNNERILNQDAELTIRDKIANWIVCQYFFVAALRIEEIVEGIKLSNFQMRDKCFQV
jgi:hypothetical protein